MSVNAYTISDPEGTNDAHLTVSDSLRIKRLLRLTRESRNLTPALFDFLRCGANGDGLTSIVHPGPGRTVLFVSPSGGIVKTKGLFGLRREAGGSYLLLRPEPTRPYRDHAEYHLYLDPNLNLLPRQGRRKYFYSLPSVGATREFDAQAKLAASGVGVSPIAAIDILSQPDESICDGNGAPTGAVVLEWAASAIVASKPVYSTAVWEFGTSASLAQACPLSESEYLAIHLQTIAETYRSVGTCRRIATTTAGVLRHAGHLENFLRTPGGQLLMIDTDTCCLAEELSPREHGAMLVRDLGSDTLRMISTVSILNWNSLFLAQLRCGAVNFFAGYLGGFFDTLVPHATVIKAATLLNRKYVEWLHDFDGFLVPLARQYATEWDGTAPHRTFHGSKWRRLHAFFLPEILWCVYSLLKQIAAPTRHWTLPTRSKTELELGWRRGANDFVRAASAL